MKKSMLILFLITFLFSQTEDEEENKIINFPLSIHTNYQFGKPFDSHANYIGFGPSYLLLNVSPKSDVFLFGSFNYNSFPIKDSLRFTESSFVLEFGGEIKFELDEKIKIIFGSLISYGLAEEQSYKDAGLKKMGFSLFPGIGIKLDEKLSMELKVTMLNNQGVRLLLDYKLY